MARRVAVSSLFLVVCLGFSLGDGTYQAEASDDIYAKELDEDSFSDVIDSSKFALVVRDPAFCMPFRNRIRLSQTLLALVCRHSQHPGVDTVR